MLEVLICTHDRAALLGRVLGSLNEARPPEGCSVEILVVANACRDATPAVVEAYAAGAGPRLPLRIVEEARLGKSNALNKGIESLRGRWIALVDDDHRVDPFFFVRLAAAFRAYPEASLLCGRILPDWDGREPRWVHEGGPYAVYPLPVPHQDFGARTRELGLDDTLPGGGNLFLRREVFDRVGGFRTDLGPRGHDLRGGEDLDFVRRALQAGERLRYVPDVVQYHYVDPTRFRFPYLLWKSYQRSRAGASARIPETKGVPRYLWRKLAGYLVGAAFAVAGQKARFYWMRVASTLGEMRAFSAARAGEARRTEE